MILRLGKPKLNEFVSIWNVKNGKKEIGKQLEITVAAKLCVDVLKYTADCLCNKYKVNSRCACDVIVDWVCHYFFAVAFTSFIPCILRFFFFLFFSLHPSASLVLHKQLCVWFQFDDEFKVPQYHYLLNTLYDITTHCCAVSGCYEFWRPKLLQLRLHCSKYICRGLKYTNWLKPKKKKWRERERMELVYDGMCFIFFDVLANQSSHSKPNRSVVRKEGRGLSLDNNRQEICNVFQMYKSNYRFDEYRMWFRWMDDVDQALFMEIPFYR